MNKEQIKNLITKIKGYYPKFNLNSLSMNEWYKELAKYDEYDVLNSLENYVNRGSEYYPKLNQLTYHLKTIEQKQSNDLNNMYVDCDLCHKTVKYSDYDKHRRHCLALRALVTEINKDIDRQISDAKVHGEELILSYESVDNPSLIACTTEELEEMYQKYVPFQNQKEFKIKS